VLSATQHQRPNLFPCAVKDLYASSDYSRFVLCACLMFNNSASSVEAIKQVSENRIQSHECSTLDWSSTDVT